MKTEDEIIIAFPSKDVAHIPDGFTPYPSAAAIPIEKERAVDGRRGSPKEKHDGKTVFSAETDPNRRQVVAYVVLTRTVDSDVEEIPSKVPAKVRQFLLYKRSKMTSENRLAEKIALGFGGHVSGEDWINNSGKLDAIITEAGKREIREELSFGPDSVTDDPRYFPRSFRVIGTIKDSSTEVNSVHLGFVVLAEVKPLAVVGPKEEAIEVLGWKTAEELSELESDSIEIWTQHLIDEILDIKV